MLKTRLNISLDHDLADFIKIYARENRTTASDIITQFILGLKRQTQHESMNIILSDPKFCQALKDVQTRLRYGSAEWHNFDEVFGECMPGPLSEL
jgi:hypothetical protein